MTERGLPLADGAPACPFVAFEDDRDERASVPDHRHRCYAEQRPAPRALAHQEAYCLSSAFPVCPTFQDWARREAARSIGVPQGRTPSTITTTSTTTQARLAALGGAAAIGAAPAGPSAPGASAADPRANGTGAAAAGAIGAGPTAAGTTGPDPVVDGLPAAADARLVDAPDGGAASASAAVPSEPGVPPGDADAPLGEPSILPDDPDASAEDDDNPDQFRRNPPRDWAAPPPWLASSEGPREAGAQPPSFLAARSTDPGAGLAGSAADQLAGGTPSRRDQPEDAWSAGAAAAAGVAAGAAAVGAAGARTGDTPTDGPLSSGQPAGDLANEAQPGRVPRRPRAYDQHLGGPDGPDWERPRRSEAYPTIRTRVAMPRVPRIAVTGVAIVLLALALFFIGPGILNIGSGGGGGGGGAADSPSPSAGPSVSLAPTLPPAPTSQVYTIKKGDTLLKVAKAHGITLDELLQANPTIKNPNKVSEGQAIVIPAASQAPADQGTEPSPPGSPAASSSAAGG